MRGTSLGEFEELVLLSIGVLATEAYGIAIKDYLFEKTGRKPSIGALHSALIRLENKGYLTSTMEGATEDRRGRRKKYYSLTAFAIKALQNNHWHRSEMIKLIPKLSLS